MRTHDTRRFSATSTFTGAIWQHPLEGVSRGESGPFRGHSTRCVYATMYQLLPFERTCEMLGDLFGRSGRVVSIGGGTLVNWVSGCAARLAQTQELIKLAIHGPSKGRFGCAVAHFDETGLRVLKKL